MSEWRNRSGILVWGDSPQLNETTGKKRPFYDIVQDAVNSRLQIGRIKSVTMNLESERRRDAICLEFEAALRQGGSARVEDFLNRVPQEQRVELLAELLPLEHTYAAQPINESLEDFLRRFPDYESTVRGALEQKTPNDMNRKSVPSFELSEFQIVRELGRGGMGVVYEAKEKSLNRRVALKVVSPSLGMSSTAVMRFRREAQAAGRLHHTNIVPVYSTGEENGIHYYAMEFIDGPSLDKVIASMRANSAEDSRKKNGLEGSAPGASAESDNRQLAETAIGTAMTAAPEYEENVASSLGDSSALRESRDYFDRVAGIVAEVAEALDHAHENGVVHRDMKPANLLIAPNGHLSITDFGLSRMLEQPGMTMSGELVGSPLYMSPEQIAVGRVDLDHRTDIYSLGATLYELLTLQPPYPGERRDQVISQILTKDPVRPRSIDRKIPTDLETICLKAMEKDPDRRYQRAGLFAEDLKRFVSRHAISARRIGPVGRMIRFAGRHRALSSALGCIFILIVILAMISNSAHQEQIANRLEKLANAKREAIDLAVLGDIDSAKAYADQAETLGATQAWKHMVEGVFSLYRDMGSSGQAVNELIRAVDAAEKDSESLSARALLATAYVWSGKWSAYKRLIRELDRELPYDADATDRFFLGQSLMWHKPVRAMTLLKQVREHSSWKFSGIVRMVYGESLGHAAWATNDRTMAMESMEESRQAMSILEDSPIPVAVCNWCTIVAVSLCRSDGRPESEIAALLESTSSNVKYLDHFPDYDIGYACRAWYYDALIEPNTQEFMKLMHESVAVRGNSGWMAGMYAAELFRHRESDVALPILNGLRTVGNDPIVDAARAILMLDLKQPGVESICNNYESLALKNEENVPAAWTALVTRLRSKQLSKAIPFCRQLDAYDPSRGPAAVKVILGKTDAESLLQGLSEQRMENCLNRYVLGLYILAKGDDEQNRRKAQEIMLPAVLAGGLGVNPETHWIRAVYEREFGPAIYETSDDE